MQTTSAKNPMAAKYLNKGNAAISDPTSFQTKRHNFNAKQGEANDGAMPGSEYDDQSRANSKNASFRNKDRGSLTPAESSVS